MARAPHRDEVIAPAAVIAEMLAHARQDAPRECCGLVIGKGAVVNASVRARNIDAAPGRYRIDPEDHFTAIHYARTRGLDVIGAYHSHVATPPVPSPADIAEAESGPDFLYVIVAPHTGETRVYRIGAGAASPVDLVIRP